MGILIGPSLTFHTPWAISDVSDARFHETHSEIRRALAVISWQPNLGN